MNTCPTTHTREQLERGFFAVPVPLPLYLHNPPRPDLDGFNGAKRIGYSATYQWGDPETNLGHEGVDLGILLGRPVWAMAAGMIRDCDLIDDSSAGVHISILTPCPECGGWFLHRYLHLLAGSVKVTKGQLVTAGQELARGDHTGNASWNHLHLEVRHSTNPKANLITTSQVYAGDWGTPYDPLAWHILETAAPPAIILDQITVKRPRLRLGSSGLGVEQLQALLNTGGSQLTEDGKFGPLTDQAVRAFQGSNALVVDGVVGTNTWTRLLDYH